MKEKKLYTWTKKKKLLAVLTKAAWILFCKTDGTYLCYLSD